MRLQEIFSYNQKILVGRELQEREGNYREGTWVGNLVCHLSFSIFTFSFYILHQTKQFVQQTRLPTTNTTCTLKVDDNRPGTV